MPELGRAALVVTLGLALYALVAGAVAAPDAPPPARRSRRRTRCSPRSAPRVVAAAVLVAALARHDFSFVYVAQHTSRAAAAPATRSRRSGAGRRARCSSGCSPDRPTRPRRCSLNRRTARDLLAWVVPVLGGRRRLLRLPARRRSRARSRPRWRRPTGRGLNPSLQNPYMLAHPPLLYLGYVGLTIPFAFAIGALLARRTDERWIVATRRCDARRLDGARRRAAARRASGPTRRSAGAATTPGTRSRTRR